MNLPEWHNVGIEPPQEFKENGWTPGVKPPAQYMNWWMNSSYLAIKALQDNKADNTKLTTLQTQVTEHLDKEATVTELGHVKQSTDKNANTVVKRLGNGGIKVTGGTSADEALAPLWRGITNYAIGSSLTTPSIINQGGYSYLLIVEIGVAATIAYHGMYLVHYQGTGKKLTPIVTLNEEILVTLNNDYTITIKNNGPDARTINATLTRVV